MENITVLIFEGKNTSAEKVSFKLFNSIGDASDFIEKVNSLDGKYWTFAQMVQEGECVPIYYNY